jgi:hypothetical protein
VLGVIRETMQSEHASLCGYIPTQQTPRTTCPADPGNSSVRCSRARGDGGCHLTEWGTPVR